MSFLQPATHGDLARSDAGPARPDGVTAAAFDFDVWAAAGPGHDSDSDAHGAAEGHGPELLAPRRRDRSPGRAGGFHFFFARASFIWVRRPSTSVRQSFIAA
jgi:hypothetical protein